jgi:hypothetical protein
MDFHILVRATSMKLRIKGNSIRFRVTPSEVERLLRCGEIREHIQFTAIPNDRLTYEVLSSSSEPIATVAYGFGNITVKVPQVQLTRWAGSGEVGIYTNVALHDDQVLSVAIEKDFACLDLSDAENEDTFPNPNVAPTC